MEARQPTQDTPAVVFAGGEPIDPVLQRLLPLAAYAVAADSGFDQAAAIGRRVDAVVGDFDSITSESLAAARRNGVALEEHPTDKDATDLELALEHVARHGYTHVIIAGGDGGRLDHLMGNALILAAARFDSLHLEWWIGATRVEVARPGRPVEITGEPGDRLSLLAVGGDADGVRATGVRWTLTGDHLAAGSTRGISNELTARSAVVSVDKGRVLVIHERELEE